MTEETSFEAFVEGCDRALFLAFQERCEHLHRTEIAESFTHFECDHPQNKFVQTFKTQGSRETHTPYAMCALEGCPIFERIGRKVIEENNFGMAFEEFRRCFTRLLSHRRTKDA